MKCTIDRGTLVSALSAASGAVVTKTTPILNHSLIEAKEGGIQITCDDLDTRVTIRIPCGDISEEGVVCLNSRRVLDVAKSLSGTEVSISANGDDATLRSGKSVMVVRGISPKDFTPAPKLDGVSAKLKLPQKVLRGAMKRVSYMPLSVARDAGRNNVAGVRLDTTGDLVLVGSDGRRVGCEPIEGVKLETASVTIPTLPASSIADLLGESGDVEMEVHETAVIFDLPGVHIKVPVLSQDYPKWDLIMAQVSGSQYVTVKRKAVLEALARVSLFADTEHPAELLLAHPGDLYLSSRNEVGQADESVPCEYSGPTVSCQVATMLLSEIFKSSDTEDVDISLPGMGSTLIAIRSGGNRVVLAPIVLKKNAEQEEAR